MNYSQNYEPPILLEYETKRKENVKVNRWNPEDLIMMTPRVLTPEFSYSYYVGIFQPCFESVSHSQRSVLNQGPASSGKS